MSQPPAYDRSKNFALDDGDETDHTALNAELDAAAESINAIRENLAILQNDDGTLKNGVVTIDSVSDGLRDELSSSIVSQVQGSVDDAAGSAASAAASATSASGSAAAALASKNAAATLASAASDSADDAAASAALVDAENIMHLTGDETAEGLKTFSDGIETSSINGVDPSTFMHLTGAETASGVKTFSDGLKAPSINGGPIYYDNKFVNGNHLYDQRNEGASQTFTAGAALAYCDDCFYAYCTGANITGQRVTVSGRYKYRFTGATSVTAVGYGQRMDADSTYDLAGKTETLMVEIASSSLTSITWTAYYANSKNTFGTLASPTRTQIATGTFTINSTESIYSTQIAIPSAATTGIEIVLTGGALLATQTLTIGDVALIRSNTALDYFPHPSDPVQLYRCEEWFEKSFDIGTAPASNVGINSGEFVWRCIQSGTAFSGIDIPHRVRKKSLPTLIFYNPGASGSEVRDISNGVNCSGTAIASRSQTGFSITCTGNASSTVSARFGIHYVSKVEL